GGGGGGRGRAGGGGGRAGPPAGVALAAVEHSGVREASEREARRWAGQDETPDPGWLVPLEVDGTGRIRPESVKAALARPDLALVQCQWANHEVGTIQPVAEIVAM